MQRPPSQPVIDMNPVKLNNSVGPYDHGDQNQGLYNSKADAEK